MPLETADIKQMIADAISSLREEIQAEMSSGLDRLEQDLLAEIEKRADDCDTNARLNHLENDISSLQENI